MRPASGDQRIHSARCRLSVKARLGRCDECDPQAEAQGSSEEQRRERGGRRTRLSPRKARTVFTKDSQSPPLLPSHTMHGRGGILVESGWWRRKCGRAFLTIASSSRPSSLERCKDASGPIGWWENPSQKELKPAQFLPGGAAGFGFSCDKDKARISESQVTEACHSYRASYPVVGERFVAGEVELDEVVQALDARVEKGGAVSTDMLYALLKGCGKDLELGRKIDALAVRSGHGFNAFVANHIIRMYCSHGNLAEARQVFSRLPAPNTFVWASMISAHAEHGEAGKGVQLYGRMRESAAKVNDYVLVAVLKACASAGDLASGRAVHVDAIEGGLETNVFVGSTLIDMYAKCGSLQDARKLFDGLPVKNVVTWNTMIAGYCQRGLGHEALELYECMQKDGVAPDNATVVSILKACGTVGAVQKGKQIHSEILEKGLEVDLSAWNTLVDMYAKCGNLQDARQLFSSLPTRNVVTWNAMIAGYLQHGLGEESLKLYDAMQKDGVSPDNVTFLSILKACGSIGAIQEGKKIHAHISERGVQGDVFVGSALMDMYAKCGRLEEARKVFDGLSSRNIVTWNAMVAGYAQHGLGHKALQLYADMQQVGMVPDNATFVSILKACSSVGDFHKGKQIHSQISEQGLDTDPLVASALIDMYAKNGSVEDARRMFDRLSGKCLVAWNTMIAGYTHHGLGREALLLYDTMRCGGVVPDSVTFASILKACGSIGALEKGKEIHEQILERRVETEEMVGNTLVDMYAKCGSMVDARAVFDRLSKRDVVSWNALINGYGQHNDCKMAMECFEEMRRLGLQPDAATLTCLLVACSHVGLVDEGRHFFRLMTEKHAIVPTVEHYTCMVDLLSRSGRFEEAYAMLQSVPHQPPSAGWISLLSACKSHSNAEVGRLCFDRLVELEPQQGSAYMLMSKIYEDIGRWDCVDVIERLGNAVGLQKKPAKAMVEINNRMHEFTVGERRDDLAAKLKSLNWQVEVEERGSGVTRSLSDKQEEEALCGHAEKLALAYALLNTPQGTTLLITKNLRMCNHCHHGTKIISRLEKREIVVRDAHRVHHFKDGLCSCGDHH